MSPRSGERRIRACAVLYGFLLCLPGAYGAPLQAGNTPPGFDTGPILRSQGPAYVPSPTRLALESPASAAPPASRSPTSQEPGLPQLKAAGTGSDKTAPGTPIRRVLNRISDRIWSTGREILTPGNLLSLARNLQEGRLPEYGRQTALQLGDQIINAAIDAGIDELRRGTAGNFLRNLEIRYQTPLNGRQGELAATALFSLIDRERHSFFGQAGGLFEKEKSGFNFGLGYRYLLANEQVLLGANLFYDHGVDADLQRASAGIEAKSTALDFYFNWYRMIGSGKILQEGIEEYTPDGFDVELAGRLPSLPWVELSSRYYRWFLDKEDVDRERDGSALHGLVYTLTLQPVPLLSLEAKLEDPEKGDLDWGVFANLKYRFGIPLQEQLRPSRVKAHAPLQRRFERVRREDRMPLRRRRARDAAPSPGPNVRTGLFADIEFLITDFNEEGDSAAARIRLGCLETSPGQCP